MYNPQNTLEDQAQFWIYTKAKNAIMRMRGCMTYVQ